MTATSTVDPPLPAATAGVGAAARWSTVPLLLVVVMLLGSVLIPARQTWRIMKLLRETTEVIEPARLLASRLDFGLRMESVALEGYALSGDPMQLARYRTAAGEDDHRLTTLGALARKLDAEAMERTAAVQSRVGEWREASRVLLGGRLPPAQLAIALQTQQASYESVLQEVARLASYMAAEGNARRELIRGSERLGLLVNASLVLLALAAVLAVGALSYRERRLTAILRRRIEEEAALRRAARALGAAATREEVIRHLAESATETTHAPGAYVECLADEDDVEFVAHHRGGLAAQCHRRARAGSLTEATLGRGDAGSLMEVDSVAGWIASDRAGLIATLSSADRPLGVLVLLRERASAPFGGDARRQVQALADLASAALQRAAVQAAERQALEEAERRARQEAALREAAEALAAAFTVDEVTQQIARTALEATEAQGAFVEQIDAEAGDPAEGVVVRAATGSGVPEVGCVAPYGGSFTELVIEAREPVLVPDLARAERPCTATAEAAECAAIAVPLGHPGAPFGTLFIVSAPRTPFRPDDLARAHTFGHLAALAYEKVRLLDEAREGRQELERVMNSRSRLMRGFSHDIKNPLGAADGFAALLSDGIYGVLSLAQKASVERIRACIHGALALIDDLHELARAETGHIALSLESVDLRDVVRTTGEEYQAAAEASGLSLSVELEPDPSAVETDRARVRQIVGNLLSNAIKYTAHGSVRLRARRHPPEHTADAEGWAAIDVSDTGRGIPAEKQQVIFEEFTRVGTDEKAGAGLGLAISQRLAQALGGKITVQSEVGHGSTFTLWLPAPPPGDLSYELRVKRE